MSPRLCDSTVPALFQRFVSAIEDSNTLCEKKMGMVLVENDGSVFGYIHVPYAEERRLVVKNEDSRVCICESRSLKDDSDATILRRITLPKSVNLDSLESYLFRNGVGFNVSLEKWCVC